MSYITSPHFMRYLIKSEKMGRIIFLRKNSLNSEIIIVIFLGECIRHPYLGDRELHLRFWGISLIQNDQAEFILPWKRFSEFWDDKLVNSEKQQIL